MFANQEMEVLPMDSHRKTVSLPLDAIGALELGQKIDAIKIVRKEMHLDLKSAKDVVEAYEKQNPVTHAPPHLDLDAGSPALLWLCLIVVLAVAGGLLLIP